MTQTQRANNSINLSVQERAVSLFGGGALLLYALKRRSVGGLIPALLGAGLFYRAATGHSRLYKMLAINTANNRPQGITVHKAVTVNRPMDEVYRFWRHLENLPHFMEHLQSVQALDDRRSHWVVKTPPGITIEWDAEIMEDRPNQVIAWRTLPGSAVQHIGLVRFAPAPNGWGTEVVVMLKYDPPGGPAGEIFAHLLNVVTAQQIKEEIRRFKRMMEAGEVPTVAGQPAGH
jgi:uncharacterized membrane protein